MSGPAPLALSPSRGARRSWGLTLSRGRLDTADGLRGAVGRVAAYRCSAETIDASDSKLDELGVGELVGAIRGGGDDDGPAALRRLHLARNAIGDGGAQVLASLVADSSLCLEELDLRDAHLGPHGVAALATALASSHLRRLDLSHNTISSTGAAALADALVAAPAHLPLTHLLLRATAIGDGGAVALAAALAGRAAPRGTGGDANLTAPCRRLALLDLGSVGLGLAGTRALALAFGGGAAVDVLLVDGNPAAGDDGAGVWAAAFAAAASADGSPLCIDTLDVSACDVGPAGAVAIAAALCCSPRGGAGAPGGGRGSVSDAAPPLPPPPQLRQLRLTQSPRLGDECRLALLAAAFVGCPGMAVALDAAVGGAHAALAARRGLTEAAVTVPLAAALSRSVSSMRGLGGIDTGALPRRTAEELLQGSGMQPPRDGGDAAAPPRQPQPLWRLPPGVVGEASLRTALAEVRSAQHALEHAAAAWRANATWDAVFAGAAVAAAQSQQQRRPSQSRATQRPPPPRPVPIAAPALSANSISGSGAPDLAAPKELAAAAVATAPGGIKSAGAGRAIPHVVAVEPPTRELGRALPLNPSPIPIELGTDGTDGGQRDRVGVGAVWAATLLELPSERRRRRPSKHLSPPSTAGGDAAPRVLRGGDAAAASGGDAAALRMSDSAAAATDADAAAAAAATAAAASHDLSAPAAAPARGTAKQARPPQRLPSATAASRRDSTSASVVRIVQILHPAAAAASHGRPAAAQRRTPLGGGFPAGGVGRVRAATAAGAATGPPSDRPVAGSTSSFPVDAGEAPPRDSGVRLAARAQLRAPPPPPPSLPLSSALSAEQARLVREVATAVAAADVAAGQGEGDAVADSDRLAAELVLHMLAGRRGSGGEGMDSRRPSASDVRRPSDAVDAAATAAAPPPIGAIQQRQYDYDEFGSFVGRQHADDDGNDDGGEASASAVADDGDAPHAAVDEGPSPSGTAPAVIRGAAAAKAAPLIADLLRACHPALRRASGGGSPSASTRRVTRAGSPASSPGGALAPASASPGIQSDLVLGWGAASATFATPSSHAAPDANHGNPHPAPTPTRRPAVDVESSDAAGSPHGSSDRALAADKQPKAGPAARTLAAAAAADAGGSHARGMAARTGHRPPPVTPARSALHPAARRESGAVLDTAVAVASPLLPSAAPPSPGSTPSSGAHACRRPPSPDASPPTLEALAASDDSGTALQTPHSLVRLQSADAFPTPIALTSNAADPFLMSMLPSSARRVALRVSPQRAQPPPRVGHAAGSVGAARGPPLDHAAGGRGAIALPRTPPAAVSPPADEASGLTIAASGGLSLTPLAAWRPPERAASVALRSDGLVAATAADALPLSLPPASATHSGTAPMPVLRRAHGLPLSPLPRPARSALLLQRTVPPHVAAAPLRRTALLSPPPSPRTALVSPPAQAAPEIAAATASITDAPSDRVVDAMPPQSSGGGARAGGEAAAAFAAALSHQPNTRLRPPVALSLVELAEPESGDDANTDDVHGAGGGRALAAASVVHAQSRDSNDDGGSDGDTMRQVAAHFIEVRFRSDDLVGQAQPSPPVASPEHAAPSSRSLERRRHPPLLQLATPLSASFYFTSPASVDSRGAASSGRSAGVEPRRRMLSPASAANPKKYSQSPVSAAAVATPPSALAHATLNGSPAAAASSTPTRHAAFPSDGNGGGADAAVVPGGGARQHAYTWRGTAASSLGSSAVAAASVEGEEWRAEPLDAAADADGGGHATAHDAAADDAAVDDDAAGQADGASTSAAGHSDGDAAAPSPRTPPRHRAVAPALPFADETVRVQVGPRGAWKQARLAAVREGWIGSAASAAAPTTPGRRGDGATTATTIDSSPTGIGVGGAGDGPAAAAAGGLVLELSIAAASAAVFGSRLRLLLRAPCAAVALQPLAGGLHRVRGSGTPPRGGSSSTRFSVWLRPVPATRGAATPLAAAWRPVEGVLLQPVDAAAFVARLAAAHVEVMAPA